MNHKITRLFDPSKKTLDLLSDMFDFFKTLDVEPVELAILICRFVDAFSEMVVQEGFGDLEIKYSPSKKISFSRFSDFVCHCIKELDENREHKDGLE